MFLKCLLFIFLSATFCFAGLNASAIISIDMDTAGSGVQKSCTTSIAGEHFKVAVRVSNCNTKGNLNYFTVRMKIDTSKYRYLSSSFKCNGEDNILGSSPTSPGVLQTDSSIEIGAAILGGTYPVATSGLLGVFEFQSRMPLNSRTAIIIEHAELCTPGPECDEFILPDSGDYVVSNLSKALISTHTIYTGKYRLWTSGCNSLSFSVPVSGFIRINLADLHGKIVASPFCGNVSPGEHRIDAALLKLPAGTYIGSISTSAPYVRSSCRMIFR
jgi:hypothetical protein